MAFGKLEFQLYLGEEAIPVTEAQVLVISKDSEEIISGTYSVNENGKTLPINLYTYDKILSEISENLIQPYKTYDALILSNKFQNKYIRDIPIFAGVTSIQMVQMVPKTRGGMDLDIVNIPPNALLTDSQSISDEELKAETMADYMQNPKVLSKVVIPEYITVHLGAPSAYVQNVKVRFIDYIKNVSSSEIYPTWPREALKANIYCQISFALNRIFTEWYRSRGYDFDITNSTAYDQYFVNGRNIFDTVSSVADEIFNEYISRKAFLEPLLAQYCNGTTVTCAGLSQWGTVDYANAGNKAFTILTKYYGDNIELRTAEVIEGTAISYPGTALKVGSKGDDVKVIQQQLNRIRQNYPAIPKIESENGVFNEITKNAVKKFQQIFNLTADGIVGKQTWYKISQIYVGVKKLAELQSEGEKLLITSTPPGEILRFGSQGENVKIAQFMLACISAFYDNVLPVKVTGYFDEDTLNSVKSFQQVFGLEPDGIIGTDTWSKLYKVYKMVEPYILSSSGKLIKYPGHLIKKGQRGEDVKLIQTWLNGLSKVYPFIPSVDPDGIFGRKTIEAVLMFQTWAGLIVDGIVGPLTWERLYEEYRNIALGI
ncbi:MAG: peptidoglycan-binding protein [Clostridium sp.]